MSKTAGSHHNFPKFLASFAKRCSIGPVARGFSRKKVAAEHFNSLNGGEISKVTCARIPFSEVPNLKFPAIYFTRMGQHPIVIKEKTPMGFSIQLWDGRESLCDRQRLEKTVEPRGYFIAESRTDKSKGAKRLFAALWGERRMIALGIGNGLVNVSLLVVFVALLYQALQRCLPLMEMTSPLAIGGIFGAILACFGYLQARSMISTYFDEFYNTHRATHLRMPPPHPIQTLSRVSANRGLVEAASAPFFLAAAALFLGYDASSVGTWGAALGCVIPAFVFLASLPDLLDKWHQALWFYQDRSRVGSSKPGTAVQHDENTVVRSHNLFLAHPEESRPPLINQVSLKIKKGEKVGVIGQSHGDVAVFLRVIAGTLNSDRGVIWIDGQIVNGEQSSRIGWFSERTSLMEGTLHKNICPGRGLSPRELEKISTITGLNRVPGYRESGLEMIISESGRELSGEDKVRIQLTRSLINQPTLLVFDSPREAGAYRVFREILEKYLATTPCTLLLGASHKDHLEITQRTIVLESGKIVRDGSTRHIMSTLANRQA